MTPTDNFISHLIELRNRLIRIVIGFLVVFIAFFPFANQIYAHLAAPLLNSLPAGGQMIATDVTSAFFVPTKVAMIAAFVVALPHTMYQTWAFVAPGLYTHEKKFMVPMIVASCLLFIAGMAFAYFVVFGVVFAFIVRVAPAGVAVMTDIGKYLDFVLTMFFAFGLAFQVPIAVVMVVRFGWMSITQLKEARGYVVVGAFIVGAIFTPPDVVSQLMLAIPMWLLYEVGLLVAGFTKKAEENTILPPAK
ncbi:MAG: twin-arginine translocase subunit TatC [Methylophilaceae bacterium]